MHITSGYIKKIIVFSKNEKNYYSNIFNVSSEIFNCVRLGYEDKAKDTVYKKREKYYLTAGRSNRDYDFLIEAWKEEKDVLKIVCDIMKMDNLNKIEILNNCYGDEYFRQLSNAYAVIIPLKDEYISSGQLVIIQAMMFGIPVIVTENATIRDYVIDGQDGFVIDKNNEELKKAIEKLADKELYAKISKNVRKHYKEKFSIYVMGCAVGNIVKEI